MFLNVIGVHIKLKMFLVSSEKCGTLSMYVIDLFEEGMIRSWSLISFFLKYGIIYGLYSSLHIYMLFNENQHHYEYNFYIFLSISP